jgi:LVIVD repeat
MTKLPRLLLILAAALAATLFGAVQLGATEPERPVVRDYSLVRGAPAPRTQSWDEARAKSGVRQESGCQSCHYESDAHTMHRSPAVVLGCTDCHGGNPSVTGDWRLPHDDPRYVEARDRAHVLPRFPVAWRWPSSANPIRSYQLINREAPEYVRFINPSDYRVVRDSCGACHLEVIEAGERSLMATGAMLMGGAAYNNGILPFKNYIVGEAYTRTGQNAMIRSPLTGPGGTVTPEQQARGVLGALYPLPTWNVVPPADVFRVFERGGRNINSQFAEIGLPNSTGSIQRLEEPGRPDIRQSNRGPGTGLRVAIPVLNIHKTRLNDPYMWFMGTNEQPGDYRHSGCAGCHVVYANDRQPQHSSRYAQFGRDGQSVTADPTIPAANRQPGEDQYGSQAEPEARAETHGEAPADANHASLAESGHPLRHVFTRAIPTSQCMVCHMHQPNIFLNSYLGYTMWDYEADADLMWPGPENRLPMPAGLTPEQQRAWQAQYRQQHYPTAAQVAEVLERNPEGAATRGLWSDVNFVREVYDRVNPLARMNQFADYHGHGWNFRGVFRRDREGNLLDASGNRIDVTDDNGHLASAEEIQNREVFRRRDEPAFPEVGNNNGRAVHMMDIHAEVGLQCADCHFAQDAHGNGFIYGEVANAVEIGCKDCHGTARDYANLRTSNPAAPPGGTNLELLRNEDGRRRFEWMNCEDARANERTLFTLNCADNRRVLIQRSITDPEVSWVVSQVHDGVDNALPACAPDGDRRDQRATGPCFNERSARAKLMARLTPGERPFRFGPGVPDNQLAHPTSEMACFTCHLSWTTSCAGCHLPIEANFQTAMHHFTQDDDTTRNFATYNPQVARDEMFQLGRHMTSKGNEIAPIRSTSALILSSTNLNRERIYIQQPPISAAGFSSQAFAPHFPHTVRLTETKTCSDCHVSEANDNNAIMAQLLLHGTNFVNFVGLHVWSGLEHGVQATRVTEWDEPQAVIGSYLHRFAYPDYYRLHVERNHRELIHWERGNRVDAQGSGETHPMEEFVNPTHGTSDAVRCLQLRGEYMFAAVGRGGFQAFDVANIGNKGVSARISTAPFSPAGQNTRVPSRNATCMALATNQPIAPDRNERMAQTVVANPDGSTTSLLEANQEQRFHPIYKYAVVTDAEEGLILIDVETLADAEPRNNFLARTRFANGANAWNPDGVLTGARHITLAGSWAYVTTPTHLVVVDLDNPLSPRVTATMPLNDGRASALQFRYLWVTDADGLKLFDVTEMGQPRATGALVPMQNAQRIYLARTYAYVAAKNQGLAIVNITRPEQPQLAMFYTGGEGQVLNDVEDVIVASTNASLFAYVADGRNGIRVLQLTSPEAQPNLYGFSPAPRPQLIAWARTPSPALALSKGLDRDRGVDETGHQMAVFGRLGSRPFNRQEQERLFLDSARHVYRVNDTPSMADWVAARQ